MPSRCITGLFGIHTTPPDMHVEPPISACFSSTSTLAPPSTAASAADHAAAAGPDDHEVELRVPRRRRVRRGACHPATQRSSPSVMPAAFRP